MLWQDYNERRGELKEIKLEIRGKVTCSLISFGDGFGFYSE